MNVKAVMALFAVGGAAVGSAVTAFVYERKLKKTNELMAKMQDKAGGQFKDIRRAKDNFKQYADTAECAYKEIQKEAEHYKRLYYDILRNDYAENQDKIPNDPVPLEKEVAPEEESGAEMEAYAITVADFMDDARYSKVYCEYYRGSNSLVDVNRETEIDVRESLGEMYELLDGWIGDEMYIRNTSTNTDYEIDFLPGSYEDGGD